MKRAFTHLKLFRGRLSSWNYGVCESQCFQPYMEDTHLIAQPTPTSLLFGVFDGHNGSFVSQFLRTNIESLFKTSDAFLGKRYDEALKEAFVSADEVLRRQKVDLGYTGATGTLIFAADKTLHIANLGHCRAVLSHKKKAIVLTEDHAATSPSERKRIEDAGGFVCQETKKIGRVHFEFSRAIGDFALKTNKEFGPDGQIMSSVPTITTHTYSPDDDFIVVGTQGLWEGRTPQEIVLLVHKSFEFSMDLSKLASDLCGKLTRCSTKKEFTYLPPKAGTGNMTCIVVTRA